MRKISGGDKLNNDILGVPEGNPREAFHKLLDHILDNCSIDEMNGLFRCNKCGAFIEIDWFDKEVNCACDTL